MAFALREYIMEESWIDPEVPENRQGIFVILYKTGDTWSMVDVSEAYDVRSRILSHSQCFGSQRAGSAGSTYYTVTYTPNARQSGRIEIEQRQWLPTGTFGSPR